MVQTRLPDRYRVIEEVGQGGMAVVYRAQDETLKREVAVKVLHPHLLAEPESKARLEREAQAVAKLQHDNILQIFDYSGTESPSSYIVTEFIDGQTLKQFLTSRKPLLPEVAGLIVIEVGTALHHAHSLGIIHRDVKPENVMVRKDGVLKLMDFGVAQVLDLERMTVTGQLLGSPAYMAPEIFEGKPLDFRTDVFSLAVMLYQMATGSLPFSGRNPHEVLKRIADGRFPDPRTVNRLVADRLARIIARGLAKRPDDRYASVGAMVDDLRAYVADAGLETPREELRRYFIDPDGYEQEIAGRVVAALVATGRREQTAGRLARALEAWNRALALDPKNPEVARELKRLEGRRRLRHGGIALGAAAALGGLIWGAFKLAREDVPEPVAAALGGGVGKVERTRPAPPPPAPAPPSAEVATTAKAQTPAKRRPRAGQTGSRDAAPALAAAPPPPAPAPPAPPTPTRTFTLAPNPKRVAVLLNGVKQVDTDVGQNKIEIPWDGKVHKLVFRNEACCEDHEVEIDTSKPNVNTLIIAPLPKKLAHLTVNVVPPRSDAELLITEGDKIVAGNVRPGEQVSIRFDATGDLHKTLHVSVLVGDKLLRREEVTVTAGRPKASTIRLALEDK